MSGGAYTADIEGFSVYVREASTGRLRGVLGQHTADLASVSFSPDGKAVATLDDQTTLRVWDRSAGTLVTLASGAAKVTCLAFSPDGATLATGGSDKSVRLWERTTGKLLRTMTGHTDALASLRFSPDGRSLLSSSWDTTIRVWDPASGTSSRPWTKDGPGLRSFGISPDWATIAAADGWKPKVRVWDLATGAVARELEGNGSSDAPVVYSPDGTSLAAPGYYADKTVLLWDLKTGKLRWNLSGHPAAVSTLAFSPDGGTLAAGSALGSTVLWNLATGTELRRLPEGLPIAFSSDGAILALQNTFVRSASLREVATGALLKKLDARALALAPDGRAFAVAESQLRFVTPRGDPLLEVRLLSHAVGAYVLDEKLGRIELLGAEAAVARAYPLCRVGPTTYPYELCAGRFELPGFACALLEGRSLDDLL